MANQAPEENQVWVAVWSQPHPEFYAVGRCNVTDFFFFFACGVFLGKSADFRAHIYILFTLTSYHLYALSFSRQGNMAPGGFYQSRISKAYQEK